MSIDIKSLLMGKALGSGGGSGGGGNIFEWDFTSATPLVDKVRGVLARQLNVTFSEGGAVYNNVSASIHIPALPYGETIEIDVASSNLTASSSYNRRFVTSGTYMGFILDKSSKKWGFYSTQGTETTDIDDPNYFSGHTLKIHVDASNKWHIYRDSDLIFEPTATLQLASDNYDGSSRPVFYVGSSDDSINNVVISAVRVY